MKCNIINYDNGEVITTVQLSEESKIEDFSKLIYEKQKENDILGLGFPCKIETGTFGPGITQCYGYNGYINTMSSDGGISTLMTGKNSFRYGNNTKKAKEPDFIEYYDKNENKQVSNLRIGIFIYPEGYILNTGKNNYNIFGGGSTAYFKKITSRNFMSANKSACKKFKDLKSLLKYINSKKSTFEYMVKTHGYTFSWEYASPEFETDIEAFYSVPKNAKKKDKEIEAKADLDGLLWQINNTKDEDDLDDDLDGVIADEQMMREEAIQRMRGFDLMHCNIEKFNNNKLMMSEFGGILYDLSESAKIAVKKVEDMGHLPYHVIVNGSLYSVLYVSSQASDWKYQRPNKREYITVYCYNAECPLFSEFGDIKVSKANGGLVREI